MLLIFSLTNTLFFSCMLICLLRFFLPSMFFPCFYLLCLLLLSIYGAQVNHWFKWAFVAWELWTNLLILHRIFHLSWNLSQDDPISTPALSHTRSSFPKPLCWCQKKRRYIFRNIWAWCGGKSSYDKIQLGNRNHRWTRCDNFHVSLRKWLDFYIYSLLYQIPLLTRRLFIFFYNRSYFSECFVGLTNQGESDQLWLRLRRDWSRTSTFVRPTKGKRSVNSG